MTEQEFPATRDDAIDAPVVPAGASTPYDEKPDADVLEQREVALPDDSTYEQDDVPEEPPDQPR